MPTMSMLPGYEQLAKSSGFRILADVPKTLKVFGHEDIPGFARELGLTSSA